MGRILLAAPTGHSVGLTSTCLGLVAALDRQGTSVAFAKPIAQPREGDVERSPGLVRAISRLSPPEPLTGDHADALLSAGRIDELMEGVVGLVAPLRAHDVVVVEGLVPTSDQVWSARLDLAMARALDADVVLVGDGSDGDLDRIAEAMAIAALPYRSGELARVVGCIVNRLASVDEAALAPLRERLAARGLRLAGAVPAHPELGWPRVSDVARHLGARTLVAGDQSRRVAEVVVCAQGVPGLLPELREDCLLLVPGDRDEVVMAACLTAVNGVRLAGLLLTAGVAPHPDVMRLTTAASATGLPILIVDTMTYPTAVALSDMDPEVPLDDPRRAGLVAEIVADGLELAWLTSLLAPGQRRRLTPAAFRYSVVERARAAQARIVLPEGAEPRTLQAAIACTERGIARCVLLASPEDVAETARSQGLVLPPNLLVLDPAEHAERFVDRMVLLRARKALTPAMARERLTDPVYVATMMLEAGEVDGLVSGAVHTTAATVRPAFELIRAAPGVRLVSSVFFMCLPDEVVVYGDCAINPDPSAADLADIAVRSADSAAAFGIEPRVAMISFSTGSSGSGSEVDKVVEATRLARQLRPDLAIDGPLQYDAAAVGSVGRSKRPGSEVAGRATVFVFPDLNTGNTTYKAVQRNADVVSVGPMLQGLAKPVNDLSRGALVDDIIYTIALTAVQAVAVTAPTT